MGISLHGHPRPGHSFESKESLEESISRKLRERERSYKSVHKLVTTYTCEKLYTY